MAWSTHQPGTCTLTTSLIVGSSSSHASKILNPFRISLVVALEDVGNLLSSFASSCLAAGSNCALNSGSKFASASALLARIDEALDALYDKPAAVYGLDTPAIATAADLRTLLYHSMYHIKTWGDLAQRLSEAFDVDFTRIVNTTRPKIHPESVSDPEISTFATHAIAVSPMMHLTLPFPHLHDVGSALMRISTRTHIHLRRIQKSQHAFLRALISIPGGSGMATGAYPCAIFGPKLARRPPAADMAAPSSSQMTLLTRRYLCFR